MRHSLGGSDDEIAEDAGDDGRQLRKAVERMERIFADDRFAANKEQVAASTQPRSGVVSGGIPWPCSTCGAAGVRNVFAHGYCGAHLNELYRTFRAEVWAGQGIGLQAGPRRPDFGPEHVDLKCSACGATWTGALFEACSWCADANARMHEHQAQLLMRPELPAIDDRRYAAVVKAWAERLARGVDAELISEHQARQALHHRGVCDVAA